MMDKFPADHLSATFIAKYLACPRAAKFYRENAPKEWDPRYAECGALVHSVIERYYNPSAELYQPAAGAMDREMERRYAESVAGFESMIAAVPRLMADGTQQPEIEIKTELCGVPFIGYIDLLTKTGDRLFIDDWKTGAPNQANEDQLRLYTLAASRIYGVPIPKITATLNYLREVPSKRQRIVPFTSERAIEHKITKYVVEPIWANDWHPNKGANCGRCEYRKICGVN